MNMALAYAPFNRELSVTKIFTDEKTKRHLENLGILVGSKLVSMYDNGGDVIVRVKDSKLALDRTLAMKIYVQ